jgi:chromosomal replication initiator protein
MSGLALPLFWLISSFWHVLHSYPHLINIFASFLQVLSTAMTVIIDKRFSMSTTLDPKQLWENVLVDIELSISPANFKTWFKDTHIARMEDGTIYVGVPTELAKNWLSKKHHRLILRAIRKTIDNVRSIDYIVVSREDRARAGVRPAKDRTHIMDELPLSEHYVTRLDNLNPRYIFEEFVVGAFNELAHAAALAVVKNPGLSYNPLFIYGSTGFGKTHLIQAVGNQIKRGSPSKKVYYLPSEKFTVECVAAMQNNTASAFKEKYRGYDLLIMDDVQFLSGKERTQEELFHLFNTLYENNKQIIFSSDKHPAYLQNIEDRLKSRFGQGMVVDISDPDHETRMAILKTKALRHNFALEDDIASKLAELIHGSIRDLEGALNTVICQTQLKGRLLTVTDLQALIKSGGRPKKTISVKELVRQVAEFYQIEEQSIYEKTRRKEVVKPRQLVMYIMREDLRDSYPNIGSKLGGRDHTTVIHSCEKIRRELKESADLVKEVEHIRMMLK